MKSPAAASSLLGAASRRVVVLAGPTAVGKSALALRLCEELHGELVSVDSVQVYRGLEIGANKPSAAERAAVPHHLLDLRDSDEEYTAGAFYADALRAVDQVLERGKVPVLVGGTSMYLRWLVRGRPEAPKADAEVTERVRSQLAPLEATGDWAAALGVLAELDPARAAQLSRNDWYRLNRALCVAQQTASTAADLPPPADPDGLDALRASLDMRCFFLTAAREPLCRRIDARCESMLRRGLLEETATQLAAGRLLPSCPAGRSIGYRQTLEYLTRGRWQRADGAALREYVEGFASASRGYARQQTKWFRNEPAFAWVETDPAAPAAAEASVLRHLELPRADFDAALASPAQTELRAVDSKAGKEMRKYVGELGCVVPGAARDELLARADACRERLEPVLAELLAQDEVLARRYPWHKKSARGAGAAEGGAGGSEAGAAASAGPSAAKRPATGRGVGADAGAGSSAGN